MLVLGLLDQKRRKEKKIKRGKERKEKEDRESNEREYIHKQFHNNFSTSIPYQMIVIHTNAGEDPFSTPTVSYLSR